MMKNESLVKVWDPWIRIFHWTLAVSFVAAFMLEKKYLVLHAVAGYTVLYLSLFRAGWGFVGDGHALFRDFAYPPKTVMAYVKDMATLRHRRYLGHNPAAGATMILMLACLATTAITGIFTYAASEVAGPFSMILLNHGWKWGKTLQHVHGFFAWVTLGLVALHMVAAVAESVIFRENLIAAMFTGYKRKPEERENEI